MSPFAFASPRLLFRTSPRTAYYSTCICMKSDKNTSKGERATKSKRPNPGVGFGERPSTVGQPKAKGESSAVQLEETSGASGDATPHRAMVPKPIDDRLKDPRKNSLDAPVEPLVELSSLSKEEVKALRFDRKSTCDEIIEYFEDARHRDDFKKVVIANRDLVTENVLYRFTSAILQVESRKTNLETRDEEARNMRQLRKELISICWSFDYELKMGMQIAEARLLNVLKGSDVRRDVATNCGQNRTEVNCFWIVIFAAVVAWEERGQENPELANVDMQKSLAAAAEAMQSLEIVNKYLSSSLKAVQKILASSDPAVQTQVVADMDDDMITELGCFTEQIRLLPTPAYGGLVQRLRAIMDYILSDKYGIQPQVLEPFRFDVPEVEKTSRLVAFSKNSKSLKQE